MLKGDRATSSLILFSRVQKVMKVQKYFMRTRMHGTPTGRPDYDDDMRRAALRCLVACSVRIIQARVRAKFTVFNCLILVTE